MRERGSDGLIPRERGATRETVRPSPIAVERSRQPHMIGGMIAYSLYTMLAIGLAVLLTAVFRRLRQDERGVTPLDEDAAFNRRMQEIEAEYGSRRYDDPDDGGSRDGTAAG